MSLDGARPIYLDYAATTPVDPAVARAMGECLAADGTFGNPSSATHAYGRQALARIDVARSQVAALIGAEGADIVFTSGATEASNLAILGLVRGHAGRGHIVTSRIEHRAVLDPCRQLEKEGISVTYLKPDRAGRIAPQAVIEALRPDTVLVSVMQVNNEIGVVQDIEAIGAACAQRGVLLHTDAAQSVGRLPVDVRRLPVDLLSFTAHKLYGPKGIGALYVRPAVRPRLAAISFGGGQERGLRPGTLPTHQIVGFGLACELAGAGRAAAQGHMSALRDRLWRGLESMPGIHLNGDAAARVPDIVSVSFEGVEGESLVAGLTELAIATGSACSSATADASYVLRALGHRSAVAQSSLRLSFGKATTEEDMDVAAAAIRRVVETLRAMSPAAQLAEIDANRGRIPDNSGIFTDASQRLASGEAGSIAEEAWVRFSLAVEGDSVREARFQCYGCPHTMRVTEWLAAQLPGRRRGDLLPGDPHRWAQAQSVPIEKLGRLLIVEDALRACLLHWPDTP